jgi:hypothetical protein
VPNLACLVCYGSLTGQVAFERGVCNKCWNTKCAHGVEAWQNSCSVCRHSFLKVYFTGLMSWEKDIVGNNGSFEDLVQYYERKENLVKQPMKKGEVRELVKGKRWAVMGSASAPYIIVFKKHMNDATMRFQCSCPKWTTTVPRKHCKHILSICNNKEFNPYGNVQESTAKYYNKQFLKNLKVELPYAEEAEQLMEKLVPLASSTLDTAGAIQKNQTKKQKIKALEAQLAELQKDLTPSVPTLKLAVGRKFR